MYDVYIIGKPNLFTFNRSNSLWCRAILVLYIRRKWHRQKKKKRFLLTLLANVLRIKVIRHPDKKETQLSVLRGQRSLQYGVFYIAVR